MESDRDLPIGPFMVEEHWRGEGCETALGIRLRAVALGTIPALSYGTRLRSIPFTYAAPRSPVKASFRAAVLISWPLLAVAAATGISCTGTRYDLVTF